LKRLLNEKLPSGPFSAKAKRNKPRAVRLRPTSFEEKLESRQAHLVLGYRAPVFGSSEYFVFRVLNTILNGMGGRLFVELREKRSLAYSVYAAHDAGLLSGAYQIYIGCAPAKVAEAKRELLEVLAHFAENGVTSEELERAKTYMIGLYQVGLQSNRSQVHAYARYSLSGYGAGMVEKFPSAVKSITAAQVQKAVRKYLMTDDKTWVVLTSKKAEK
jgi:zinc protease